MPDRIGKYEVVEEIGRGGFATVYKARDPLMKRVVAIKLCSERDEDMRRRFLREAQIAGSLDHPSIVRGFDCGFDEAGVYLVEEYLDGEDLSLTIRSRLPLPYRKRLAILIEVAQAIAYAHSKGVYHRDLKPGNIRILESGRVKLMDFGIAKMSSAATPLTKAGTLLGTAGYVAPEQVLGKPVDYRVDIFAFGALSYELLTYKRPFTGETVRERLNSVLEVDPPPIPHLWAGCPPALDDAIARCLKKDPAARYQTFAEVIADLERVRSEMSEAAEAPTATLRLDSTLAAEVFAAVGPAPATVSAPPAGGDATLAGPDATLIVAVASPVAPPPPRSPPSPPPPAASGPEVDRTMVAPPVESARPRVDPGRRLLEGARRLTGAAVSVLSGASRIWVVVALAAAAALITAIVIWSVRSGEDAAGPDPEPEAPPVAAAALAPAPDAGAPPAEPSGRLVVSASPWGELLEVIGSDGRSVVTPPGSTTPLVLTLPPGEYEVRVARREPGAEPRSCRANVLADATGQCRVELAPVTGLDYFKESGWWQ